MDNNKELNLFDLCVMAARAVRSGIRSIITLGVKMIRVTYRQWFIVLPIVLASLGSGIYYSLPENRTYQVDGTLLLNGPSLEAARAALNRVAYCTYYSSTQNTMALLGVNTDVALSLREMYCYDVIDCLADSIPDYVDYTGKISYTDTLTLHMHDRIAIRMRVRNINNVPEIEKALLRYLNEQPELIRAYETYKSNLELNAAFCHSQMEKLDSLTSSFYFHEGAGEQARLSVQRATTSFIVGDRRIRLFLGEIRSHIHDMQYVDQKLAQATAPIVMEGHLTIWPKALNGPLRTSAKSLIFGWIVGCLLAALIEQRKQIIAWLKK